jgi:photosystem II stability/assembly factor-like uncharacterized protein
MGAAGTTGNGGSTNIAMSPHDGEPWLNITSNLAGLDSECGNMTNVSAKPDEDMLIAGIAQRGLWSSTDGGDSWVQLGSTKDAAPVTNRTIRITYDPENTQRWWENGIYNAPGLFRTDDDGATLVPLGNIFHNDFLSIDFTDPKRKVLLAGGHEQLRTLYKSVDGGETFTQIGENVPKDAVPSSFPYVIDANTYLLGGYPYGNGELVTGILRSTDGGDSWERITEEGGYYDPLRASDHSIYWSSGLDAGMVRSEDDGETWTQVTGPNVLMSLHPIELPDGRIASVDSNKRYIVVSADHGDTWSPVTPRLPYVPYGISYSGQRKQFIIWYFSCGTGNVPVPDDAIMAFGFDYEAE